MLDQNTDRMWYVIGAVIVGAALIFLMNGAFPTLFANVGETFEEKVDQTTEMTDGIRPVVRQNLIIGGEKEYSSGYEFSNLYDLAPIFDKNGLDDTYTLIVEMKSNDTSLEDEMRVYMQSGQGTKYSFISQSVTVTEDYQTFTFKGLKPFINSGNLQRETPYTTAHLAFYGTYQTGNNPIVRNVRLYKE